MNIGMGNPGNVLLKLEAGLRTVKVPGKMQRGEERDNRDSQGEPLHVAIAARENREQQRASERQERNDGENVAVAVVHRTPRHTMKAITAAAPAATQPA